MIIYILGVIASFFCLRSAIAHITKEKLTVRHILLLLVLSIIVSWAGVAFAILAYLLLSDSETLDRNV